MILLCTELFEKIYNAGKEGILIEQFSKREKTSIANALIKRSFVVKEDKRYKITWIGERWIREYGYL